MEDVRLQAWSCVPSVSVSGERCEITVAVVFQKEAMFVGAILFYLAWYFIGKNYNISRAHKWLATILCPHDGLLTLFDRFDAHLLLYETQFTKPVQRGGLTRGTSYQPLVNSRNLTFLQTVAPTSTLSRLEDAPSHPCTPRSRSVRSTTSSSSRTKSSAVSLK